MICPHCRVSIPSGEWNVHNICDDFAYYYNISHFFCGECQRYSIKFNANPKVLDDDTINWFEEYIIPKNLLRKPVPNNVEDIYRNEYYEAVNLLPINPMASAAFSRRVLQHYIEKKIGIKKSNLEQEIKEVKNLNHYPSDLVVLFNHIRHYGVIAAHAKTDQITAEIIDIDPEEAEWLLTILEELFDFDYVRPKRIAYHEKKMQEKLKRSKPSRS